MVWVLIVCIVIAIFVIAISVVTTNKAYSYQHNIDPIPDEQKDKQTEN